MDFDGFRGGFLEGRKQRALEEQDMDLVEFAEQDTEILSKTSAILNDANNFLSDFGDSLRRDEENQDSLSDIDLDNSSDFGSRRTASGLILNAPTDPYRSTFEANRVHDESSEITPPFRPWDGGDGSLGQADGARRYKRFTALSSLRDRKRAMLGACGLALAMILVIATSISGSKSAADGPTPTIDSELSVEVQPVKESRWYLDQDNSSDAKPACIFGNNYPDDFNFELLFGGYLDCCKMFPEACSETIHEVEEWLHENVAPKGKDVEAEPAIAEPSEDDSAIESNGMDAVEEEASGPAIVEPAEEDSAIESNGMGGVIEEAPQQIGAVGYWYAGKDKADRITCLFGTSFPGKLPEHLFDSKDDCCDFFPGFCRVHPELADVEAPQQIGGHWFAGSDKSDKLTCLFGASFPGKLPEHLFDSKDDCCDFYPGFCQIRPELDDAEAPEQSEEPADRWFIGKDTSGKSTCLFGSDYPTGMHMEALFDTKDECCDFSSELCQIILVGLSSTGKVVADSQPQQPDEATYHWFPGNGINGKHMCLFSSSYPEEIPVEFLYDTRDECCEAYPASCNVERWVPSEDGSACVQIKMALIMVSDIPGFVFETEQECDDHLLTSAPEAAIESKPGPVSDDETMLSSVSQISQDGEALVVTSASNVVVDVTMPNSSSEQPVSGDSDEATEPSSHSEIPLSSAKRGRVLLASVTATIDRLAPDSSFLGMPYVGGTRFVSYLRFDLVDLPENDVVVKAGLSLNGIEDGAVLKTSTARLDVNKVTPTVENWILGDVTWNNGNNFIRSRDLVVSQDVIPGEEYFGVEVTSAVRAAIERGDEYIIFEISTKSPDILSFATDSETGSELSILSESQS